METNYFKQREEFRVVMLQTLKVRFPKMAWRQVSEILGKEQTRVMFNLMRGDYFYLLFMVDPKLPEDVEKDCEDLFENPKLAKAMNAFRVAKIKSYLTISKLSDRMRAFLEALFYYLKVSGNNCGCCCDDFIRAQKHFQQMEQELFVNLETVSEVEQDLLVTVAVLALEEFSQASFNKVMEICGLTA